MFQSNNDSEYPYEDKFDDFHKKLLKISNQLGLGENIPVKSVYDEPSLEKIFIINVDYKLGDKDRFNYLEQIIDYMDDFCRKINLF